MSRRAFLQTSAGVAAVAVVGAGAARTVVGGSSSSSATETSEGAGAASASGPFIVHIDDVHSGRMSVLSGTSQVVYHDPDLVARVVRAAQAEGGA